MKESINLQIHPNPGIICYTRFPANARKYFVIDIGLIFLVNILLKNFKNKKKHTFIFIILYYCFIKIHFMKKTALLSIIISSLFIFSLSAQSLPLQVGTVSSGGATALTLTDAQLSAQLSDILNNRSLSNAVIQSATDDMGLFYFIRANVPPVGSTTSGVIIIVLSQSGNTLVFTGDDCTMECSAGLPCGGCFQNIISRCKSQECKCTTESGGCTSTISFPKK